MENHLTRLSVLIIKGGVKMFKALLTNYADVTNLISSIGFPCFMCTALMYYIYKMETKTHEILTNLTTVIVELKGVIDNDKE